MKPITVLSPSLRRSLVLVIALLTLVTCLHAQQTQTAISAPLDVAITFQSIRASDPATGSERWLKGGAIELHGRFFRGLGMVASVTGAHCDIAGDQFNLVTTVFGPRYTLDRVHGRIQLFGQGLAGIANEFGGSTKPGSSFSQASANSLAVQAGGGLDINLSQHFGVRAIQVDYLRTQLSNGHSNVQNMPRIGGGVVIRFGQALKP